jgi:beta-lactam-binding protein with PASTA domain
MIDHAASDRFAHAGATLVCVAAVFVRRRQLARRVICLLLALTMLAPGCGGRGNRKIVVPLLLGLRKGDAISKVHALGLEIVLRSAPAKAPLGFVYRQKPQSGAHVRPHTRVFVFVSASHPKKP